MDASTAAQASLSEWAMMSSSLARGRGDTQMNLSELQADLRHSAAERDWQPFHMPKNLCKRQIA